MSETNPHSTAKVAGHPLHPMIIPFPIAFLVTAFVTDLVFLRTGSAFWATGSIWLLGAGVATALLAAVFGFTDFLGDRQIRALRTAWWHMGGNLLAVAMAAVNWCLRFSSGAQDAVAGAGVILSGLAVALLLFNGWMGWELVYRHHVGIANR